MVLVESLLEGELRLGAGVVAETARIHVPHVDVGLPVNHPLRQELPGTWALGDADGCPVAVPVVAHPRCGPHEIARVGGVGDRPGHNLLDARVGQHADALLGEAKALFEHIEVLAGQMEVQVPVDAVDAVGPGAGHLVRPNEQAIDLLAVVARGAGIAHHWQFEIEGFDFGHGLGHQVLVDNRHDRNVEPDHGAELGCVVPGGVHDVLAVDGVLLVAAVRTVAAAGRIGTAAHDRDIPTAVGALGHAGHERVAHDPAAEVAGTLGHSVRAARRIGPAVMGCVEAESHVVEIGQQRVPFGNLRGADQMRLDADLGEHGVDVVVPVGLVGRTRQSDCAAAVPARRQSCFGLQAWVERNRFLVHLGHVEIADEVRDQAGRVPSGPGRQLALLDEDRVGPALMREGIQQAGPHGSAADDDALRVFRHAQ